MGLPATGWLSAAGSSNSTVWPSGLPGASRYGEREVVVGETIGEIITAEQQYLLGEDLERLRDSV